MSNGKISALLVKSRKGSYKEVIDDYHNLSQSDKLDRLAMFAFADALYELARDIESLEAYIDFINHYPNEKATSYALFGVAVSLKNLNLQIEALKVLKNINNHEGVDDEINDCNQKIKLQSQAKVVLNKLDFQPFVRNSKNQ